MSIRKDNILSQLSILSELTRVRILRILLQEECSVTELISVLEIPQSTISRHLKILLEQGWVSKREDGNSNCYRSKLEHLSKNYQALWKVLSSDQRPLYEQDYRRLQTVISLRMVDSTNFFQKHATQWAELRKELFGEQFLLPTLLSIFPANKCIADLGCGNGEALLALAPSGCSLIGVDISKEMLSIAEKRTAQYNNISLREGSLSSLPIDDNEADYLFCMLVLHHISDINQAFQEMHRCLKPEGKLIILDMHSHQQREFQQMGHLHLGFSQKDLEAQQLFEVLNFHTLPKSDSALGPELFIATMEPK